MTKLKSIPKNLVKPTAPFSERIKISITVTTPDEISVWKELRNSNPGFTDGKIIRAAITLLYQNCKN